MSDTENQALASTGSGKSEAEIAFELLNKLKGQGVWGERNLSDILDMYAECLDAAKGLRVYEGQNRVEVAIKKGASEPELQSEPVLESEPVLQTAPPQTPVNMQPSVDTLQNTPPVMAPAMAPAMAVPPQQVMPQQVVAQQAAPQHQPVHAQQQAVAQAFKPAG